MHEFLLFPCLKNLVLKPIFCYNSVMSRFLQKAAAALIAWAYPVLLYANTVPVEVILVQPLDDTTPSIQTNDLAIITYFEAFAPYFYTVAVGFCTLWTVIGGILIMVSGSNTSRRDQGKQLILVSIAALLILTFGGFVLRTLNDTFFVT